MLREEHVLRVVENRALRRMFGPKRDKVTGGCRELHNEKLHNMCSSPSTYNYKAVNEDEMSRACATKRNAFHVDTLRSESVALETGVQPPPPPPFAVLCSDERLANLVNLTT
jgi:hypothetical protein